MQFVNGEMGMTRRQNYHEHNEVPPLPAGSLRGSAANVGRHQALADDAEATARARKRSPRFPTLDEAERRIRHRREDFIARAFLLLMVFGTAFAIAGLPNALAAILGAALMLTGAIGFIVTCFISAERSRRDNGGHGEAQ